MKIIKIVLLVMILAVMVNVVFSAPESINVSQKKSDQLNYISQVAPKLTIRDVRQDPYPANPGEYLDLYISIGNTGGNVLQPRFELNLEYPFSLDLFDENEQRQVSLGSGEKVTLHYKVRIDQKALPGNYEVEFKAYADDGIFYPYYFNIRLEDVTTDFDVAMQNVNEQGVSIALSNIGKNDAKSITLRFDNQEDFEILGASSQIIGNLNEGDYTIVSILLNPKDQESNELNVKLQIDYTDIIGNRRYVLKTIPVIMNQQTKKGFNDLTAFVVYGANGNNAENGSNFFAYLSLVFAVAIVGILIYFKKKKNKDDEE